MTNALDIRHVDVLFGPETRQARALELLDSGQDRDGILAETGVVVGVADASLEVPAGSISVLMGLSGSGKSSLLRCVNGLNHITRGNLLVRAGEDAIDVAGLGGKRLRQLRRQHLAMVFQQFALLPWATVRENIGFGLSVRGESVSSIREAVDRQLELVHLEAWADKPIATLSGGMQQRVGLARAFATDAEILLMDEPFSALDPLIREHLQDELLDLQRRLEKTIVFVSHDLEEALKLGDTISIMDGGRIVQTGTADDIVFSPASDYVRRFVAHINPLSVLTAGTLMRPIAIDAGSAGSAETISMERSANSVMEGTGLQLNIERCHDGLLAVRENGESIAVRAFVGEPILAPAIASVIESTPVRSLIRQAASSERPVLVMRGETPCGLIRREDILEALVADARPVVSQSVRPQDDGITERGSRT